MSIIVQKQIQPLHRTVELDNKIANKRAARAQEQVAAKKSPEEDAIINSLKPRGQIRGESQASSLAKSIARMVKRVGGQAIFAQANQSSNHVKTFLS